MDCADAIDELHESLASLYEDNFNNIQADFDNQLALLEHQSNTYQTGIDTLEAKGYLGSSEYYHALQDIETQNLATLNNELVTLQKSFDEAMASGEIEEYSEAWYSMQIEINNVQESIDEANLSLLEYDKTMREIEWGYFDFTQERIGQLTQEADFLIDLMSNADLHTDKGQLTDEGMATMGLHAQNYNVYMAQADKYAQEILKLDDEIAKDPYNTDLLERREELLGLQQDSILAAGDEKQAIVDLVREGINIELQALQDLIDAYTDSLDSAKDLYEYQKKIKEQTIDIANLQKQLSAYENDTSEENRAKVQQIKVDLAEAQEKLAETEYDQFVSETKKLLDDLYDQYEEILNERLDNIDVLLSDMIDAVNTNSVSIGETLVSESEKVGYTMTECMKNIWSNDGVASAIVAKYGDNFSGQLTAINQVLNSIHANVMAMVAKSDAEAEKNIDETSPATTQNAPTGSSSTSEPPSDKFPPDKAITIGGLINAGNSKIYGDSYGGGCSTQYFKNDPIYTVLGENNGYYKVRWHKLSSGITGWFKKGDVKAYKTGGLVDYTGLAQVDGTPEKPELMLNAKDTENFIELRDILRTMSQQPLSSYNMMYNVVPPQLNNITPIGNKLSGFVNPTITKNMTVTFGDIKIDHVEDYNDFVNQLRRDEKFERFIQSITNDLLFGGSSLAKNKFQW